MSIRESIAWLFVLMPGFISIFLARSLSDLPGIRDFDLPIAYLCFSFVNCGLPLLLIHSINKLVDRDVDIKSALISPIFLIGSISMSAVTGIFFAILVSTDALPRFATRYVDEAMFPIDSYSEPLRYLLRQTNLAEFPDGRFYPSPDERWINRYVRLSGVGDGLEFEGVPKLFHNWEQEPQVYLTPACVIRSGVMQLIYGPGVWVRLSEVSHMSVIDTPCSECALMLEESAGSISDRSYCHYEEFQGIERY